jgi:dolichol-phosphate mannosyltransferase
MDTTRISVVIAAFNEQENIEILTKKLLKALSIYTSFEIIYVVAGTDRTREIIERFNNPHIKMIYGKKPTGLGNDFKKGFLRVSRNSDYVITMDADLNHQPEEIKRFIPLMKKNDIVIGSRHVHGSVRKSIPFWKRIISDFTNTVFSIISGVKIKDKTSGFRSYRRTVIQSIARKYTCKNFEFLLEILLIAKKLGYSMAEVPITFTYRTRGTSKFRVFTTLVGYFRLLFKHH